MVSDSALSLIGVLSAVVEESTIVENGVVAALKRTVIMKLHTRVHM